MTKAQLEKMRIWRKKTGNASTRRYEKTVGGFLMRLYRNMQSRVTGVQHLKNHLYLGKTLLGREEFYVWARGSRSFKRLFTAWEKSGYDRRLTPTVDRINPSLGYELPNMRWLTHSKNSSLACRVGRRAKSRLG